MTKKTGFYPLLIVYHMFLGNMSNAIHNWFRDELRPIGDH